MVMSETMTNPHQKTCPMSPAMGEMTASTFKIGSSLLGLQHWMVRVLGTGIDVEETSDH